MRAVYYEVAPKLDNGRNLFDGSAPLTKETLEGFRATPDEIASAEAVLRQAGLSPIASNEFSITAHSKDGKLSGLKTAGQCRAGLALFELEEAASVISRLAEAPGITTNVAPLPPTAGFFNISAPSGLRVVLNATSPDVSKWTGAGCRIAVVDSGCDTSHPFFRQRKARIDVIAGPSSVDPSVDTLGHGTMICGTIVSLAPHADITVIKVDDDNSLAGFKTAVSMVPRPDIIQNTWGQETFSNEMSAYDRAVYAALLDALMKGCMVVFAAGNQKVLFPAQVPEIISAGGAYMDDTGRIFASSYASGYESAIFEDRVVPDFAGVVGPAPKGVYISLPTSPGSIIDRSFADRRFPQGDGGFPDDGWVIISGTSSASAQISAALALLREIDPSLDHIAAKELLATTAVPVNAGMSAQGSPSGPPYPNLATGHGLIDIQRAVRAVESGPASRLASG